jgi:hypothetical protein
LDACVTAALQQKEGGTLFGWRQIGADDNPNYRVSVITPDGKIADANCNPSATANMQFENRLGARRFANYKRISVPEETARNAAPTVFEGPVKVNQMEIDTDIRGNLSYEYHMTLPSGHAATSQVDTVTGLLINAEVEEQEKQQKQQAEKQDK